MATRSSRSGTTYSSSRVSRAHSCFKTSLRLTLLLHRLPADSSEPFSAFEERHPELVAIDRHGRPQQKVDLFEKERHENSELTCAREVSPGFIVRLPTFSS